MEIENDLCQIKGCKNDPLIYDYGICICKEHLTPEIEAAFRRMELKEQD